MSLRLLPAFVVDNDEDDDGNFTKWMSSYWGHGAETAQPRERKRSFRRPAKTHVDRRSSLPTVVRSSCFSRCCVLDFGWWRTTVTCYDILKEKAFLFADIAAFYFQNGRVPREQ